MEPRGFTGDSRVAGRAIVAEPTALDLTMNVAQRLVGVVARAAKTGMRLCTFAGVVRGSRNLPRCELEQGGVRMLRTPPQAPGQPAHEAAVQEEQELPPVTVFVDPSLPLLRAAKTETRRRGDGLSQWGHSTGSFARA